MNTTKKININVSSLVGLKAELLRKHTEVKDAKARIDPSKPALPKVKVKSKKIKTENEKLQKNIKNVTEIEDVNTLKKSKYMLLAKSRLYDKLKKNRGENNENYLVDFKNKYYESSEEEPSDRDDNYEDINTDPEEDWVDYQDCFGRTRRCLSKDLPRMKEKDSLIEREITKKSQPEEKEERIESPVFISPEKEPGIEIMRKKWMEQTEKLANKSNIHYQDILFDEARAHGVAYYAFSHDEDERAKQQSNLAKLRKETEQKQKELQEIKNLKSKMEDNRLKTARIRARIRAGLPLEPTEDEIKNNPPETEVTSKDETPEVQSLENDKSEDVKKSNSNNEDSLAVIEDKVKAFGELLGKRLPWRELSQEEWVHKRRKDRQGEFAPIYDNFKSVGMLVATKHNQLVTRINNDNDPLIIRADGPEPTDIWESSGPEYRNDDNDKPAEVDNSDKDLAPEQSITSKDFPESLSIIHPNTLPSFNRAIPPPSVVGTGFPLSIPTANTIYHPTPSVLYPAPPPFINSIVPSELYSSSSPYLSYHSQMINLVNTTNAETNEKSSRDSSSDSDSNDSDIIGPMPPPLQASTSTQNDDILANIPLPDNAPPTETQNFFAPPSKIELEIQSANPNIDKITAGLRYLREKFENKDNS